MSNKIEVPVPDIGDFDAVDVIEILVSIGDTVGLEDPLITLESDKATMDIPAPQAGTVAEIKVALGDQVAQGTVIVVIDGEARTPATETTAPTPAVAPVAAPPAPTTTSEGAPSEPADGDGGATRSVDVLVPDIGDFEDVEVIEILASVGDTVAAEDPLLTLESDKATMDIPAPAAGTLEAILVKIGDRVSQDIAIARILTDQPSAVKADAVAAPKASIAEPADVAQEPTAPPAQIPSSEPQAEIARASSVAYASPGVRKFARELGVNLDGVAGTGRKGRITKPDVKAFVKTTLTSKDAPTTSGFSLAEMPTIDFSKFGEIETAELSKVRQLTGQNLHRSWVVAPHVTQFDEADITELEAFRKLKKEEAQAQGVKLTLLAFLVKAIVTSLKQQPDFNSSLSSDGKSLVVKHYYHIGIAVNTERGLVVPVLRDADKKGIYDIAAELQELSTKARERKLRPEDMQGGCFTISSLGGIGGTAFTPIINVPEVAILGVSAAAMKPVYNGKKFIPRLILPLSLSYDHRVIDGVAGAQFTGGLSKTLGDIRNILL